MQSMIRTLVVLAPLCLTSAAPLAADPPTPADDPAAVRERILAETERVIEESGFEGSFEEIADPEERGA